MNENARKLSQFRVELEVRGDGKCYFPCFDCRGLVVVGNGMIIWGF